MSLKSLVAYGIDNTVKLRRRGSYILYVLSRRILQAYDNNDVDMRTNGEHWLQKRIGSWAGGRQVIAMDVGANKGEWVEGFLEYVTDCRVYCYEPVPNTCAKLRQNINDPRVEVFDRALSSREGSRSINTVPSNDYLSSFEDVSLYDANLAVQRHEVETNVGDQELERLGIGHLDILKVDAEGHDLEVLRGFRRALADAKIDLIQFEYNVTALSARVCLKDFFDLLTGSDYLVCRLLPNGLEACGYHHILDDFRQSNWVGVPVRLVDSAFADHFALRPARGLPGGALSAHLDKWPSLREALRNF